MAEEKTDNRRAQRAIIDFRKINNAIIECATLNNKYDIISFRLDCEIKNSDTKKTFASMKHFAHEYFTLVGFTSMTGTTSGTCYIRNHDPKKTNFINVDTIVEHYINYIQPQHRNYVFIHSFQGVFMHSFNAGSFSQLSTAERHLSISEEKVQEAKDFVFKLKDKNNSELRSAKKRLEKISTDISNELFKRGNLNEINEFIDRIASLGFSQQAVDDDEEVEIEFDN